MLQGRRNQYVGVNAHLQSLSQNPSPDTLSLWSGFHSKFVSKLDDHLSVALAPLGFFTRQEGGIQLRIEEREQTRYPDVSIYDQQPEAAASAARSGAASALVISPVAALQLDEADLEAYPAIKIFDAAKHQVGMVELLSPTNLPGGSGHASYKSKRREVLLGSITLVEIDLQNHHRSLFEHLQGEDGLLPAKPYVIAVTDPRPDVRHGETVIRAFGVDEPIPTLTIPLGRADLPDFDLTPAYNEAFEQSFFGAEIDYQTKPAAFDDYAPADRVAILARMLTVQDAASHGADLDHNGPFPVTPETLAAVRRQVEG